MPLRILLLAWLPAAHAHHAMDYATPATALDGLLSGLAHPVIGVDHLLFIVAAGVLAAQARLGLALLLAFVIASVLAAALRAAGAGLELHEAWVAVSLLVLAALLLGRATLPPAVLAALFAAGGMVHGQALGASVVGAEQSPLAAYFIGLIVVQCAIAASGWALCAWVRGRWPSMPLQRFMGATLGGAALLFLGL
ncbi:MAG TPA: HupE/UreJ family protein [Burkholderiales bacterium]|nr:HupE/UreJ family protein [Burkholderiales bacterium]